MNSAINGIGIPLKHKRSKNLEQYISYVRFQVLTAASMMFRIVFWDVLPCKMIVDHFTWQYIPEDNSEQYISYLQTLRKTMTQL
jgi:hypothetical protein